MNLFLATYLHTVDKRLAAKKAYEAVLREHETSAFVHTRLASLSMKVQDIRIAEQSCRRAIEIAPDRPEPYFLLGQIMIQRYGNQPERWDEIVATFEKVVELDPDHIDAYQYLGEIAEQTQDYESAVHVFKELTRIAPYHPIFFVRLGGAYERLGKADEAISAYERAIKIDHDLWEVHRILGQHYVEQVDHILKEPDLTKNLLQSASENLEKAIRSYAALRRLTPPDGRAEYDYLLTHFRTRLGSLYVAIRKAPEAVAILEKILETEQGNVDAAYWLGIAYQELGDFERAENYLRKASQLAPDRDEVYNALGYLFAERGTNLDEAIALIHKALEKAPENGAYLDSLGWVYFKQGKVNEALVELEKASRYMPDSAEIQDHLGDVYFEKGLKGKAIAAWKKAIEIEPDNIAIQEKLKRYQGE
jgi:tetratricopeptide (TPR) repeat protein